MNKSVMVIPSWYPPDGGEFFRLYSQSILSEGIPLFVVANHIKSLKTNGLLSVFKKNTLKKTNADGLTEYHCNYFKIPGFEEMNIQRWSKHTLRAFERYCELHKKPALIHVHSTVWAGYAAFLINQKYNIPYIVTEHRSRFVSQNSEADKLIKPFHHSYIKQALEKADRVITVSNSMQKKLISLAPLIKNRLLTIPNMVDTNKFKPSTNKNHSETFRFFCLGALEHVKGIDLLLKAFALFIEEIKTPVKLIIGGDGKDKTKLQKMSAKLNLVKHIHWSGSLTQDEVVEQMQNSHAFILPSRFEAFGVVFIEAMACGLPVIATNSGGPTEIISHQTGLLAENENVEDIKNKMVVMFKDYQNYDRQYIRSIAIEQFSKEAISKQYSTLITEILK
ncbi:MAG: glycosyltransferase [Bacteroidales bacterium]|nr:glycosyltransferase [Bacteroidales bacterium]